MHRIETVNTEVDKKGYIKEVLKLKRVLVGIGVLLLLIGCDSKSYDIAGKPELKKAEDLSESTLVKNDTELEGVSIALAETPTTKELIDKSVIEGGYGVGETVEVNGVYVTVNSVEVSLGKEGTLEDNFKEIVKVNITYQNVGEDLSEGNDFKIYNNLINQNLIELSNDFTSAVRSNEIINGTITYGNLETEDTESLILEVNKRGLDKGSEFINLK